MKSILSSTALVLALSAPAFAQQDGMFVTAPEENVLRASELVGARLYVSETEVSQDQAGMDQNWQDAGEISEIAMGRDGQVDFIVADIGGFLGMGEKSVAVSGDQLQFVADGENAGEWFIVVTAAQADLENAPEFEGFDSMQAMASGSQNATQTAGQGDGGGQMETAGTDTATQSTGGAGQGTGQATASAERQATDDNNLTAQVGQDSGNQTTETETETAQAGNQSGGAGTTTETGTETETAQAGSPSGEAGTTAETETETAQVETEGDAELVPTDGTQTEQAQSEEEMQQDTAQAEGSMAQEGYTMVDPTTLTAEDLTGRRVFDGSGEVVGDVGDLVLGSDGQTIEQAVIDVGGFLGIGEKPVAISIDELSIQRQEEGGELRVTVPMSKQEMKDQPRYEG